MKLIAPLIVSLGFPVAATLHAQTEHRLSEAHVHGTAQLTVLQEGRKILVEFITPAANIVGYEDSPKNDTQIGQIESALHLLETVDSVLRLSDLDCDLVRSQSSATGQFAVHMYASEADNEHETIVNDTAGHDHKEHDIVDLEAIHAGFQANFELDCRFETTPNEFAVTAFESFNGIEILQLKWVLNGLQGAEQLSRSSRKVVKVQ